MIDLYTWSTPNGRKVSIMLEECGLEYAAYPVDISKDEQFKADFLKISPNNRIPAIIDRDNGRSLFESGAILRSLAEKIGQVHHFLRNAKGKAPCAEERYLKEAHRLYGVLDRRLAQAEYMAGTYSIADMATWPCVSRFEWHTVDLNKYPNVLRWYKAIAARPAVVKRYHIPVKQPGIPMPA